MALLLVGNFNDCKNKYNNCFFFGADIRLKGRTFLQFSLKLKLKNKNKITKKKNLLLTIQPTINRKTILLLLKRETWNVFFFSAKKELKSERKKQEFLQFLFIIFKQKGHTALRD